MVSAEYAKETAELYYEDIYHFCYVRLRKEADAHDVVQDVFLFFQENYGGLDDDNIKSWLFSVANNKIKEKFREIAKREKELILGTDYGVSEGADIVYETEQDYLIPDEEIEEKKKSILSQLTEKELKLFEMVYVKHLEYEELAKALDIAEGTARTRVYRLKNKIKEKVYYNLMVLLLLVMKL